MCLVYQCIYGPMTLRFLSRYSRGLETFFLSIKRLTMGGNFLCNKFPVFITFFCLVCIFYSLYILCSTNRIKELVWCVKIIILIIIIIVIIIIIIILLVTFTECLTYQVLQPKSNYGFIDEFKKTTLPARF